MALRSFKEEIFLSNVAFFQGKFTKICKTLLYRFILRYIEIFARLVTPLTMSVF